jgi:integrase/recombinase XerD
MYHIYKKEFFPKLVDNPNILPEDKQKIRELLKKPWNHYIIRHSSLTEKSTILKESTLRQFAGWHVLILLKLEYHQPILESLFCHPLT